MADTLDRVSTLQDDQAVVAVRPVSSSVEELTVSILICTRNRGDSLVPTVTSILGNPEPFIELLVVDQSTNDLTRKALEPFIDDPRLRYIYTDTQGKGKSSNLGLREAQGDIVVITDDDCEVVPGWIKPHLEAFKQHPKVVVTYGQVLPVEFEYGTGFIPAYTFEKDGLVTNIWEKCTRRGIGANSAVRRKEVLAMGGFDPELGPGGKFHANIDGDMTMRAILNGYYVYEAASSRVMHYGFRNWEQGRTLTRNAWYGIGASFIKPLKCSKPGSLIPLTYEFFIHALIPFVRNAITFTRPLGWLRVIWLLRGVRDGLRAPVDKEHILFNIPQV